MKLIKIKDLYEYVAKLMEENKGECKVKLDLLSFAPDCSALMSFAFDGSAIELAESYKEDKEIAPTVRFENDKLLISYP